jgi:hypothetical protein
MSPSRDPLEQLLPEWRVEPRRNPRFRAQVWQRIGAASDAVPWPVYLRSHATAVAGALALAVAVGAIGGWSQARARVEADSSHIASSYVQTLDARNMRIP